MGTVIAVGKGFKTEPVKTSVHRKLTRHGSSCGKLTARLWILKETMHNKHPNTINID